MTYIYCLQTINWLTLHRILIFVSLSFNFARSTDEVADLDKNVVTEELNANSVNYKGIFATPTSNLRGTIDLTIPGGPGKPGAKLIDAKGIVTLHSGETIEVAAYDVVENKSTDAKVFFDSEDLSFTFFYDVNGNPKITNVVYKNQQSSILVAEHTADSPVKPVTGTYKCTNCQDQNSTINGIAINNVERTFNMLLTTADGGTAITVQALVGILVDTKIIVNESCSSNGKFTFCSIKSGDYQIGEPVTWSGVHRYTSNIESGESCSTLSGMFDYASILSSIKGEFKSDSTCPNTTYFVSPTGNDTNSGLSPEDAWQTIDKINNINLQPGDQVLFEGGKEFPGNLYLDSNDGNNAANPVKISSYGTGKAKLYAGDSFGIYAYNTAGFIIDNLIVAGSGMNVNTHSGIYFANDLAGNVKLDFIEVTNCEVFGFREFGIVVGAWNGNSGFSNVLIEGNKVYNILDRGISSYGHFSSSKVGYAHSNIIVRDCEVYNIKGYSKGAHSGNGIVLSDVQFSTIEHSTVYNSGSGNTNCGGPVGIWFWDADNVTIQFNEVYNMSSGTGCDGGGFDLDGGVTNGTMQYNYSHDNDGAGYLIGQFTGARPMSNITVRYNISQNDAATNGGSVYLFNGQDGKMKDIYVYHNTFYLKEQSGNKGSATIKYIVWKPVKENINFYNNILIAENGADFISVPAGYAGNFAGNLYHTTGNFSIQYNGSGYSSLASFRSAGKEMYNGLPTGTNADPLLAGAGSGGIVGFGNNLSGLAAYKLSTGSPAFNSGIIIPLDNGTRDFYGNSFSSGNVPDVGAQQN